MNQVSGNLWEESADYVVITTNGYVKVNGCAVMGRGVALQAKTRYPGIDTALGSLLKAEGNHVGIIAPYLLIALPVKHHWQEPADLELIKRSLRELNVLAKRLHPQKLVMPMPGTGNGQRKFEEVMPLVLAEGLGDNVTLVQL